jgi:hypothetical protein
MMISFDCRLGTAPQPTPDVHSGVLNSAGAQSSFRRNNVSRALFFAPGASAAVAKKLPPPRGIVSAFLR